MSQSQNSKVIPPLSQPPVRRVIGDVNLPGLSNPLYFFAFCVDYSPSVNQALDVNQDDLVRNTVYQEYDNLNSNHFEHYPEDISHNGPLLSEKQFLEDFQVWIISVHQNEQLNEFIILASDGHLGAPRFERLGILVFLRSDGVRIHIYQSIAKLANLHNTLSK